MADTIRDRTTILSLLADNATGDISPQDHRDAIVSMHGVYGEIRLEGGSTSQTGIGTTPTKVTGFATDGLSAGATPANATDQIAVGTAGTYLCLFSCSLTGSDNEPFKFELALNGTGTGHSASVEVITSAERSTSFVGLVTATGGDLFTVLVNATQAAQQITPIDAQLIVRRIA
jgi:hypothetical protein